MLRKILLGFLLSVLLFLLFAPPPFQALPFSSGQIVDFDSLVAPHNLYTLGNIKVFSHPDLRDAEDIDVDDSNGEIYTGIHNGSIIKISSEGLKQIGHSQHQILGVRLAQDVKSLYFVDLKRLCRLWFETGEIEVLADSFEGQPFNFLDNLDVAEDGRVYFTDASTKYGFDDYLLDFLEGRPYGRVYVYSPESSSVSVLLENLYFANGVAITSDQKYLLVAETYRYRILKYHLQGSHAGTTQVLIDNLPAHPDNVKIAPSGHQIWIAFPSFRNWISNLVSSNKKVRETIAKLPRFLWAHMRNMKYAGGAKVDVLTGQVTAFIKDTTENIAFTTCVLEKSSSIYFGTLHSDRIGRIPKNHE